MYVLVEEARLRCEALLADVPKASHRELRRMHHHLGLTGLHVSTTIPPPLRHALLARVHSRCDHRGGGVRSTRGFERSVRRAARELARALSGEGSAEHRELAHLHLLKAMEFLAPAPVPGQRSSAAHAFRQRHLA